MKIDTIIKTSHIAPCGMNCSICRGYLRKKNKCLGCREIDENITPFPNFLKNFMINRRII